MDRCKILLVEDEHKIADTLQQGLSENGYEVAVAYDGNAGYEMFRENVYNLVALDLNLPGISGFDLCKKIRETNQGVPIIMLTALNTLNDKIQGYGAGADDYLLKPFEFRELLMKMQVLIRRTGSVTPVRGDVLSAGGLVMNLDTKKVFRNNQEINLTIKEFQLLEYLLRNKNTVLSRADIAINVWDIDFDTNTNIIDVYINYVRNKVDKPFDKKLIHTQVGVGYILKEA
jgi:DNA-binding response OmpR family regulator